MQRVDAPEPNAPFSFRPPFPRKNCDPYPDICLPTLIHGQWTPILQLCLLLGTS
jgi:hypothetical protein